MNPDPTNLREVMVSNLLDHPSATLPALMEYGSEIPDDVTDAYAIVDRIIADERLTVALSTPPTDDVREPTDQQIDAAMATLDARGLGGRNGMRVALKAAFEVPPRGTVTDAEVEPAETYSVYGGQGLRRIASGLSREDAERVSRKFEIDCMDAGLTNPPGRIEREARS